MDQRNYAQRILPENEHLLQWYFTTIWLFTTSFMLILHKFSFTLRQLSYVRLFMMIPYSSHLTCMIYKTLNAQAS